MTDHRPPIIDALIQAAANEVTDDTTPAQAYILGARAALRLVLVTMQAARPEPPADAYPQLL